MYVKEFEPFIVPFVSAAFVLTATIEFHFPSYIKIGLPVLIYAVNAFYRWRIMDEKEDILSKYVLPFMVWSLVASSIVSLLINNIIIGTVAGVVICIICTVYSNKQ